MGDGKAFWELKETAKWSNNPQEKKTAIAEMLAFGERALPSLEEIMNVTVYEEIKTACIEAIKEIKEIPRSNATPPTTDEAIKKNQERGREKEERGEVKLADLPP